MIARRPLLLLAPLAPLAACAPPAPRVHVDRDPTADFSRFRSFGWASPLGTDRAGYTTLTTERFKAAVERELTARGYVRSATPDLLVNFSGKLEERTRVDTVPAPMPAYYGYRFYGAWPGYSFGTQTFVDQYLEGTINIDIIDRRRNAMVWEGVAVGRVTREQRQNPGEGIADGVAAIFAQFPYRAGMGAPAGR